MASSVEPRAIATAAALLREGRLVAFPTETVYGLGARADDARAVRRIYEAKGRPAENPSIVHTRDADRALALADHVPEAAKRLAARFWPGPLTLVLPVRPGSVAPEVTAGGPTIALRVPAHPVAQALLAAVDLPIAAPSANASTTLSPTTAAHVRKSLGDRVDLVLDGGPTGFGIESTIVDVTREPARVLRRGSITLEAMRAIGLDVIDLGDAVVARGEIARAPGTQARHYAPTTPLEILALDDLVERASAAVRAGARVAVLSRSGDVLATAALRLADDPVAFAAGLYAALHQLDDAGCDRLFVEAVPAGAAWDAVRDRLARAAHPA